MAHTTAGLFKLALGIFQQLGVQVAPLLKQLELSHLFELEDPYPLEVQQYRSLWQAAVRQSGDHGLGLRFGEAFSQKAKNHLLLYIMLQCPSAEQALVKLVRYHGLVGGGQSLSFRIQGNRGILRVLETGEAQEPHSTEGFLMALAHYLGEQSEQRIRPEAVCLTHSRLCRPAEYRTHFGVLPEFGCSENSLVFSLAQLAAPLANNDPELLESLEQHANELMARRLPEPSLSGRVRHEILRALPGESPSLVAVAKRLNTSQRSLQQGLKQENTSYRELLDQVRKEKALRWIGNKAYTFSEIAFLLGFAEQSAFNRAFKRWTGQSPKQFQLKDAIPKASCRG
ncbi:MAG: hypothetical protein A2600_02885 [Candidatus Lambdaproteobacteria bacterium RIFOXYD1_FULL_56_27]|uniref:HTH araC/xylS-type domain-containing protein n=1 Tax=Candidatus Lambdaproteobacteria bacterium RIFOXYD2_FULL_56_26 TaxID=1817773 RepID=A0A1F6H355_9PROT|nr:MAG: hypothetical protein A2557_06950 [Candidatus Lambdaproteobacteria bacterium RIFOXYD2_FULL_56_26]OGH05342.1 MAG: hypothetical protein A2426_05275 [Candidatus Lambdaproteobacteria bacterium RIFOXYC1_FULL_56_13]OGH09184.1 MAG: hypothetical protein A2600_02885 [Candidatus Lambdaproteobacteria bacterium RIFOXYD1_FULL_56_27]